MYIYRVFSKIIQIQGFTRQLSELKPKISAVGFFNIDLHLIPKVFISHFVLLLTLAQSNDILLFLLVLRVSWLELL